MKSCKLPFSQVVKRRTYLLWAVLALLLAFMVLVGEKGLIDSRSTTGLSQLSYKALYFGGVIYTSYKIHYNRSLIKNKEKLRQEKILRWMSTPNGSTKKAAGRLWIFFCFAWRPPSALYPLSISVRLIPLFPFYFCRSFKNCRIFLLQK